MFHHISQNPPHSLFHPIWKSSHLWTSRSLVPFSSSHLVPPVPSAIHSPPSLQPAIHHVGRVAHVATPRSPWSRPAPSAVVELHEASELQTFDLWWYCSGFKWLGVIPSRELTYPTLGKGKSSSKCHFGGDMLVPWRVVDSLLGLKVSEIVLVTVSCRVVVDFLPIGREVQEIYEV